MKAPDLALIGFVAIIIIILAFAAVVLWQVWAGTIKLDGLIAELDPARRGLRQGKPFPLSVPALHLRGRRTVPAAFDRNRSFHPRPRRRARTDRDQQRHLRRLEGRVEPSEQT
jgi:hypothetical protein